MATPMIARRLAWTTLILLAFASRALADGGKVQVNGRAGAYQVAVFTSPTPLRAGPVDFSVLVQDAETGEPIPAANVQLSLSSSSSRRRLRREATPQAATNKLFQAALFTLPSAGEWQVNVAIDGPQGPTHLDFVVVADEPLPRWLDLWPWFGWPVVVIVAFALHEVSGRSRSARETPAA